MVKCLIESLRGCECTPVIFSTIFPISPHCVSLFQNEQGVAVPIFVKTTDKVEAIYTEAATTRLIHRGSLKGKAFFHKDQRLKSTDVIGDVGIQHHDSVRLKHTHTCSTYLR
ncbi:hypothetical protein ANCCAN_17109 [Ancylostoma caninum]|uniref:Uncharacterized protein n=1 Tax=Ancylostoma caninum TaxID=29170 RepID=A0A368FY17_ANCCA|nr:hypothetical protein ANCCAN_17109 [Ancylostoma caninum]